ncbi:beta-Ala-His dipeptidase [Nannocystaceae bacterium ST9]
MPDPVDPALDGLEPQELWRQFDAIRRIPRPSLHEEGVRTYLRGLAERQGWKVQQDAAGNLLLRVPGAGRGRNSPTLALQGHMDMVCEKDPEVVHDFHRDPIALRRTTRTIGGAAREVLQAVGTTLGSDNGLGCATALALAIVPGLDHPPLELLFTADEEQGMSGALALDPGLLTARRLINFDAELEGRVYLSCAGGRELHARWQLDREPRCHDDVALQVTITGLRSGHSGVDIHEGRGNAIALLIQLLTDRGVDFEGVRLAHCEGGTRSNVIARQASAVLWCARARVGALTEAMLALGERLREPYATIEPDLRITIDELPDPIADTPAVPDPISAMTGRAIFEALRLQTHGVLAWSPVIPGLVETSNNLAVLTTSEGELGLVAMARSSRHGAIEAFQDRCERALEASGATIEYHNAFPGWEPRPDTELVVQAKATYRELFKRDVILEAIHAGLECGILGDRVPGLEMIAFGPDIHDAHTPDESLVIDTVEPFWRYAVRLVASLC